jgi:hypothetical protein
VPRKEILHYADALRILGFVGQALLIRPPAIAASRASRRVLKRAVFSATAMLAASCSVMAASTLSSFFLNFDSAASRNRFAFVMSSSPLAWIAGHHVLLIVQWKRTGLAELELLMHPSYSRRVATKAFQDAIGSSKFS